MTNEIKPWIIKVSYGYNCSESYGAYAIKDPLENDKLPDDFKMQAEEDLWYDYGWTVTGWNNENIEIDYDDDPEAWQEEYDQIYEDFKCDIEWDCYIDEDDEINSVEIVYDERKK
jgi:hypothetical protein